MKDNVPLLDCVAHQIFFFFKGIPVDVAVNIFINSFGSIQETTMVSEIKFMQYTWRYSY